MTNENIPTSPAKRFKLDKDTEDDEDSVKTYATNSFYGKKSSGYLTPLERKARRESLESSYENTSQSSADENEIVSNKIPVLNRLSVKKKTSTYKLSPGIKHENARLSVKKKTSTSKLSSGIKRKNVETPQKPLTEIKMGSPRSPVKNVAKGQEMHNGSPNSVTSSDAGSEKRFFKNRTPLISKSSKKLTSSASKMTQKGLKMVYKPASLKNKVTPASPDLKFKKRPEDSPDNLVRRSPRKHQGSWRMSEKLPLSPKDFFEDTDSDSTEGKSIGGDTDDGIEPIRRSPRKHVGSKLSPVNSLGSDDLFSNLGDSQQSQVKLSNGVDQHGSPRSQSSVSDSVRLLSEIDSESNSLKSPGLQKLP